MENNDLVITVENISKRYRIGMKEETQDSLGGAILSTLKKPITNFKKYRSLYTFKSDDREKNNVNGNIASDIVWALRDISFQVKKGEILGIIGNNGAGKSTLLKILSRISDPTSGKIEIRGKVSSLLEVGTGFHPELTGRENIYLNAVILGMTKKEVDRKFDDIVDFSGVGKFIDTPVKRYSSGMRVRLAFSVSAHMDPEVLIIDEVLAVGDVEFQKKCIGKMQSVSRQGRTVLFVSHNLSAISQLCTRAIMLEKGRIKMEGSTAEVISSYMLSGFGGKAVWNNKISTDNYDGLRINNAGVLTDDNQLTTVLDYNKPFKIEIGYDLNEELKNLVIMCQVADMQGNILWTSWDMDTDANKTLIRRPGRYVSTCNVPGKMLKPARYLISVGAFINNVKNFGFYENVIAFEISTEGFTFNINRNGLLTPALVWEVQYNGLGRVACKSKEKNTKWNFDSTKSPISTSGI